MTQRKSIRHAVVALLVDVMGLADRVHPSRSIPVDGDLPADGDRPAGLPCVLVYTDRDPADKVDGYQSKRNLSLRIVVIVRQGVGADDALDDLCEAVEQTMEQAVSGELDPEPELAALLGSCDYVDTALTYTGEEGRAELVRAEMTFTAVYYRDPVQTFADLKSVAMQFDMASPRNDPPLPVGPDGQVDAAVTVALNQ
jgi:hypothetical protein